ncbi:dTMP kinase [Mycoplasmopsis arginini]|uniref:Thymidylate kinase n=1 Tax=Mycoplasmopsis arginini TaxID=2094 RepID=A0AA43TWE8_MYCAR|nr:dTMP kinase [Mycoplasmopsis arginini]MCY2903037.1 dTMP kinase [Mycoplasmopsis arginini QMP CG1-2758]MDI3348542.1 dTMP kinase [Mycoplasmopsis arginini]MDI3349169.1 dTMP kinase [Mycoplasmopsis arginini]MDI3349748.1 dTMP kinase [Mycoplasmopsis arginini]MDI3350385.1 dTMP kinase [Mycoplasmopsis arginini]
MQRKGKFIAFEGMDGSGKTTIIQMLKNELITKNLIDNFVFTREPGSAFSKEAEKIRQLILDNENSFSSMVDALLFATSRRLNLEKGIWPALEENKNVITDRYTTSSYVYQGVLGDATLENVEIINKIATNQTEPDFVIFFDLEPSISVERITKMREGMDRLETSDISYYVSLRESYKKVIAKNPERYRIIDANCSIIELFNKVVDILKKENVL